MLRNKQHQPIFAINVQQRLQYSGPSSQRSVSVSTMEKHKHNSSQRCAVDLRSALKQSIRVLIANMRRDYVPARLSNYQGSSYVVSRTYTQVTNKITGRSSDHSIRSE